MYKKPDLKLYKGRVDSGSEAKRWHQKIEFLLYPFEKKRGIALLGFECDEGVKRNKGRIGAKRANDELKKAMGNFAFHLKNSILYDAGKVIYNSNLEASQEFLATYITMLLTKKHFPLIIGGGHEVAFASFMGLFNFLKKNKDIAIINFDAHFDLRNDKRANSGTPFAQIASICKAKDTQFSYLCLGISEASNTQALFTKAKELNSRYILDTQMTYRNFENIKTKIDNFLKQKKHIYISIDTDVFSAFSVPAVSALSSRGIEINITYDVLEYLFINYKQKIKIVDFAEFNPKYDIFDIGKKAVSRLIYDVVGLADKYLLINQFNDN
ncbi:MAG: formimidoylglutamase [Campylobacteraceae bacterium]|nr:formimidoylglutamase [Campylobacteraceae bacterium]